MEEETKTDKIYEILTKDKKEKKKDEIVGYIFLAFTIGICLGLFMGMHVGYIQGEQSTWEMMKTMILIGR